MPDASHEAVRDLVRAREAAMYWRNRARQALSSFLLRHGYHYGGRSAWTASYWRWLATLKLEHPAQQITMQEYILAIQEADARHDRLVKQIEGIIPSWSMAPLVIALQAIRAVLDAGEIVWAHSFELACARAEIDHRLTKPAHPWTNAQVERMNRTLKDATVRSYHYQTHEQLREHLAAFVSAYSFAKRLKALAGLTPFEAICKAWTKEPQRFRLSPDHLTSGLNI